MEKLCRKCKVVKPNDQFKADRRYGEGISSYCKQCHQAATVAWQKANPDRVKAARRKRYAENKDAINAERKENYNTDVAWARALPYRYGITADQYKQILAQQGGCAICGRSQDYSSRRFSVDHDHRCCPGSKTCGQCVRGILCHSCNVAVNAVEKIDDWAGKAEIYLERFRK